ncbi:hypothetical protein [Zobellia galactanivorans]|uniref:Uncharacterized protein n=1 Tax=Zobellia galactanivorans (strain DSM 12802 / CCUG 47099 / CIP 106680 / NCIMB 13871 / Dsij) TaxID=63186 RepID=G0L855_ZOBGA|nr:hypothetical protein [Zobellia galactanivorans]CAZ97960.1 Hypothetical protein ZOBELLIA_3822 [Zobellia galactanivorans]
MEKMMHLAAQYLAAAGISFVEKKADDSHTNLGWSIDKQGLETHPLSIDGDVLALNYNTFSLEWNSPKNNASFALDGKTHEQVLEWLTNSADAFLGKKYTYDFHYDLPYSIDDSFTFKLDAHKLKELTGLRTLAQSSLEKTLEANGLSSDIRIWPHHFDSGAYVIISDDLSIGFGLAVPDTMINEHYFYISGYKGHDGIETSNFTSLSMGEWKNEGFKGAVLPATKINEAQVVHFFTEAINTYKK